jgi:hypothetical protein
MAAALESETEELINNGDEVWSALQEDSTSLRVDRIETDLSEHFSRIEQWHQGQATWNRHADQFLGMMEQQGPIKDISLCGYIVQLQVQLGQLSKVCGGMGLHTDELPSDTLLARCQTLEALVHTLQEWIESRERSDVQSASPTPVQAQMRATSPAVSTFNCGTCGNLPSAGGPPTMLGGQHSTTSSMAGGFPTPVNAPPQAAPPGVGAINMVGLGTQGDACHCHHVTTLMTEVNGMEIAINEANINITKLRNSSVQREPFAQ